MPSKPFATPETTPRYARSRTYDLQHVRLELQLDPAVRRIRGEATLRLAPLHEGLRVVELDLASSLEVTAVRSVAGPVLRFERVDDRLRVHLPRPAPAGRELGIAVAYQGEPRRGLYFVGPDAAHPQRGHEIWSQGQDEDSRYWFPCFDSPHDKATSEVIATVPARYRVVSNGRLVEVRKNRATHTYHWKEEFPHPAYLVSIVVGEYIEVRDEADGVPLFYHVRPHEAERVERTFGRTPAMMRFFAQAIGYPYPYEKYAQTVVGDFVFGGMENVSATTLTDAVLLDATAALDSHCDSLIAHELAHQWWGNLLTCKEWSHAWLNEGFATYFDALFTEHHRGRDEFRWQLQQFQREYFSEDEDKYRRPIVERRYTKPIEIFDRHLYEKGALVLHMLRHELGDELFWKSIRHYARKHQFQNVETTDFKVAIEEATGHHLDGFFDQWVYGFGFPEVEATWSWDEARTQVRLRLRQTQSRDGQPSAFSFGLDVELGSARHIEIHRLRVEHAEQTFEIPAPARPAWVRLDPGRWLLGRFRLESTRDSLLAQLRASKDPYAIADAADGLGRFVQDSTVVHELGVQLAKPRFFAAKRAIASALGRLGGAEARAALVAALEDPDLRARRGVVRALGEFRHDRAAAAALEKAWKRERSYFVRAEIVGALARAAGSECWPTLEAALALDSFRDVIRAAALRALGELEEERGFDLARRWSGPDATRWARDAALRALAALGRAIPTRGRAAQEAIEAVLRETSFFAVLSAAEALGKLGRSQALPALRRLHSAEVDARLQKAAHDAIAVLTGPSTPETWKAIRTDLEQARRENHALRERVERLEAQLARRDHRNAASKRSG